MRDIMGENKKTYLQPVIEIEYFDDVDLLVNTASADSPYIKPGEEDSSMPGW